MTLQSCIDAPDYPDVPQIEYIGLSSNTMNQSAVNEDSLTLFFSFTDGDGDLGLMPNDAATNIVVTDTRDRNIRDLFKSPFIPEDGIGNGISGEIQLKLYSTCCIFPDGIPPCDRTSDILFDTLKYEIFIRDRAGNQSNVITTDEIILKCSGF